LLALITRKLAIAAGPRRSPARHFATALFYATRSFTPAISVLSAVEGLTVVEKRAGPAGLPLAVGNPRRPVRDQARVTAPVGRLCRAGDHLLFLVIGGARDIGIAPRPRFLPRSIRSIAIDFFLIDLKLAFLALGAVVAGGNRLEALYADMGQFGRRAIMLSGSPSPSLA